MNQDLYDRLSSILANNNNLSLLPSIGNNNSNNNNSEDSELEDSDVEEEEVERVRGGAFYGAARPIMTAAMKKKVQEAMKRREQVTGGYFKKGPKKSGWYERKHKKFGYGPVSDELRAYFKKHSDKYNEYLPKDVKIFKTSRKLGLTPYQKFVKQQFATFWDKLKHKTDVKSFMAAIGARWRKIKGPNGFQDSKNKKYKKTNKRFVVDDPEASEHISMESYIKKYGNPYGPSQSKKKTKKKAKKSGGAMYGGMKGKSSRGMGMFY